MLKLEFQIVCVQKCSENVQVRSENVHECLGTENVEMNSSAWNVWNGELCCFRLLVTLFRNREETEMSRVVRSYGIWNVVNRSSSCCRRDCSCNADSLLYADRCTSISRVVAMTIRKLERTVVLLRRRVDVRTTGSVRK